MTVSIAANPAMKLRRNRYHSQFLDKAVDAARSMMMGDSMMSESGNTALAKAARLISGASSRAIKALTMGRSNPINNQLAAKVVQVFAMTEYGVFISLK